MHIIFECRTEPEVIGLLHREVSVPDYLRLDAVTLARRVEREGHCVYRADDHNALILVVCEEEVAARILQAVADLGERLQGAVRAFATPAVTEDRG